jgi:aspartate aminotransferase-like enzyme
MVKKRLLTPGPVMIPPEALGEMARPIFHHRTPESDELIVRVVKGLKYVLGTSNDVLVLSASGTGGMEAAVVNFLSPGDKVLLASSGIFGRRFGEVAKAYGADLRTVQAPYGQAVDPGQVESYLKREPGIKMVIATLCETTTGVVNDIKALGTIVKDHPAILAVDAISGLGADELRTDLWGVDVVVGASQKALMASPGVAIVSVSPKAWALAETARLPKFYWNLKSYKAKFPQSPFTPPVSLMAGLSRSLTMIEEMGIDNLYRRYSRYAGAVRSAVAALGLSLFASRPSNTVTAVNPPANLNGDVISKTMRETYGVTIAGGQGELKGKIFRIGNVGYVDEFDILAAISALEATLNRLEYKVEWGEGLKAAQGRLFAEPDK